MIAWVQKTFLGFSKKFFFFFAFERNGQKHIRHLHFFVTQKTHQNITILENVSAKQKAQGVQE